MISEESLMSATAFFALILTPLCAGQAGGLQPAPLNIAVINLATVFERYQMTRDLEQVFAQRRRDVKAEAEKKRDDLSAQANALQQFKPGTDDYRQREEELTRGEVEFEVWLEVQERRLKSEHKAWLEQIYQNTQDVVAAVAAKRGLDLVLTYSDVERDAPDSIAFKQQILLRTVIYANERTDLTKEVIELLDADYQKRGGVGALELKVPLTHTPPAADGG